MFDVLIIGGGVSSMSCALILGSSSQKPFASDKIIGIITHQKASSLQSAVFNNAYGIEPGKLGSEILAESIQQLEKYYPHIVQISNEKVLKITGEAGNFSVSTNKQIYFAKLIIIGIGATNPFVIEGLEHYIITHKKSNPEKNKIQLQNEDHLVSDGIYVCGTLAGHRSQLSIAAGSGAAVATDVLTLWNNGIHVQVHDSVKK
ncbi:NAD(P)/FAD-dependent oxidoreductase [Flavobacterium sp.]